ncbi:MAG: lipid-A-disaccharide synthase [Hyphococcus sp.]
MTREAATRAPTAPAILISAVEPSGDALGAALIDALRKRAPEARFFGCGGRLMAARGMNSAFPIDPFAVIGPMDALKAYPAARRGARALAALAADMHADAAVLIDSWAFSKMAAATIKTAAPATRLFKYAAPQVWASRPQRAEQAASLFDGVMTLFAFEPPWFEKAGLKTRCVGNPVLQAAASATVSAEAFRRRHAIGDAPVLAVLPGSRKSEVIRLLEPFRHTLRLLREETPSLQAVMPVAPAVSDIVRTQTKKWRHPPIFVEADARFEAFAAADAAIAASGTVTSELAIFETPMIVAYRVGAVSALWLRNVMTTPYVTLLNIAAQRAVVPEFLQEDCDPVAMASAIKPLLSDTPERRAQLEAFPRLLAQLGVGGAPAAETAAATVLEWIAAD